MIIFQIGNMPLCSCGWHDIKLKIKTNRDSICLYRNGGVRSTDCLRRVDEQSVNHLVYQKRGKADIKQTMEELLRAGSFETVID